MSGVIMGGRRRVGMVVAGVMALVVAAAVAFVALRGNGSTVEATPTVTATSSPVVTPSQTPTPSATVAAPELPAAAKKRDQKGAEAFFRYFIDVYNYSFASLDQGVMQSISTSSCRFCAGVVSDVEKATEQGLRYEGADLRVLSLVASPGEPDDGLIVVAILRQAEGRTVSPDGSSEVTVKATPEVRVDAGLRWIDGGWQVFAVTLPGGK